VCAGHQDLRRVFLGPGRDSGSSKSSMRAKLGMLRRRATVRAAPRTILQCSAQLADRPRDRRPHCTMAMGRVAGSVSTLLENRCVHSALGTPLGIVLTSRATPHEGPCRKQNAGALARRYHHQSLHRRRPCRGRLRCDTDQAPRTHWPGSIAVCAGPGRFMGPRVAQQTRPPFVRVRKLQLFRHAYGPFVVLATGGESGGRLLSGPPPTAPVVSGRMRRRDPWIQEAFISRQHAWAMTIAVPLRWVPSHRCGRTREALAGTRSARGGNSFDTP
jgi:hypothetical protein